MNKRALLHKHNILAELANVVGCGGCELPAFHRFSSRAQAMVKVWLYESSCEK